MSSGFGLKGNVSKCFGHFTDFTECMKTSDSPLTSCNLLRDDYFECLHNRKMIQKAEIIKKQEEVNLNGGAAGGHGGGHH